MKYPIETLTDIILRKLSTKTRQSISWDDFSKVCGEGNPPGKTEAGYYQYINERHRLVGLINKELVARSDASRVVCENAKGIKLLPEDKVAEHYALQRIRKAVSCQITTVQIFEEFCDALNTPDTDRKMLERLVTHFEAGTDTILGGVLRMRSLSDENKRRLLDEFKSE